MNKPRQHFKGESLARGPMDTMHGKVIEAKRREKVYPAPVKPEAQVEVAVAVEADTKAAE